eukprot:4405505-Pleurochrysis_carterae.AAC.1
MVYGRPPRLPAAWRVVLAPLLAWCASAAAQVRCGLSDIRQNDGSFQVDRCEELRLHGEKLGDEVHKECCEISRAVCAL